MIIKRAITRYITYFSGVSTTAFSIFLINYFLDSNEFAVWGVANSLIYILAQLGQLTYVQYVEKYFPNLNTSEKKQTLYMFIKTTFIFFPLWFFILIMLYFLNYFSKFNITNIGYLFLMITVSVVIEASLEIVSKYLLTTKETIQLDKKEFIYSKLLRLFIFTLLLLNGFSIYHLLFTNIMLRAFLLVRIINLEKDPFVSVFKNILKTPIWDNNFLKIRYTIVAFGIKALLISFLNMLFLFYSSIANSEAIAIASLGVLIINNLRPAVSSLTSLLSPMISQNVEKSVRDTDLISNFLFVNSFSASIFLIASTIFVQVYNYFLNIEALVGYNPDKTILLSILACVVSSLYYPKLWYVKFSNLENRLLKYILIIFLLTLGMFLFFPVGTDIFIFYIIFEILVYFVCYALYKSQFPNFKNKLAPSIYVSVVIVLLYQNSISNFYIQLLVYTLFCIFDFKKVQALLNSKSFK